MIPENFVVAADILILVVDINVCRFVHGGDTQWKALHPLNILAHIITSRESECIAMKLPPKHFLCSPIVRYALSRRRQGVRLWFDFAIDDVSHPTAPSRCSQGLICDQEGYDVRWALSLCNRKMQTSFASLGGQLQLRRTSCVNIYDSISTHFTTIIDHNDSQIGRYYIWHSSFSCPRPACRMICRYRIK